MEDHRLKSYCLVVETRSFSRAARAKHMTQSAMSRLVKNLEDELGVMLLLRKGKTVVPTAEGRLFYEHAKTILEHYARMAQDIGSATRSARGALRLGASRTPAAHLLPQVLYDFSRAHPQIRIDLLVSRTSSVLRDLRDGRIDVGIVEGVVAADDISAEPVADDEIVVIAPEDHKLAKKRNVTAAELFAEPFILPEPGSGTRELIDAYLRDAGVEAGTIRTRMSLSSPELVVAMVRAGLGLAFASKWSVFTAVREGTVKLLRLPGRKILRRFYVVSTNRELAAPAGTFRKFILGYKFFVPF